jgi:hypothetical protein
MQKLVAAFIGTLVVLTLTDRAQADPPPAPVSAREAYSYTLAPGGSVSLEDASGSISVVGWAKNVVQIEADKCAANAADLAATKVDIVSRPDVVTVSTIFPQQSGNVFSWLTHLGQQRGCTGAQVDYVVHVPHDAHLALRSASADIDVSGPVGPLSAQSASGSVTIKNANQVSASSESGDLELTEVHGALSATSASGSIVVNKASGDISVKSASGDLGVYEFAGKAILKTISGDITVRSYSGVARIDSTSGDVSMTVVHGQGLSVSASTTSGDISSDLPLQPHAPIDIHTISGDISVRSI